MFRKLMTVKPTAWLLLALALVVAILPRVISQFGWVDANTTLYVVQPVLVVGAAVVARALLHGQRDRIRHKSDKALIICSVLSVWFVLYFLSGLAVTYVHNAVASSWLTVGLNLLAFGSTAAAVEYIRYVLMLKAGRRNIVWFGAIVGLVLSAQQLALIQFPDISSMIDNVKFVIAFVIPAVFSSVLLTYLAFSAGLQSQLAYSLGVVVMTVLPPIIPKYDWYMTSMTSILLAIAVYIMIDRSGGETDEMRARRRHRRPQFVFNAMFGLVILALVLFMTGVFSYKPVVILSDSMVPVFSRGSVVVIQKVNEPMDITTGDIIQYASENKTITHRVVAIDIDNDTGKRVFTTKGDNSPSRDPPVDQVRVIGIIRSTIPYIGLPTVWLKEISTKH